jgi:hypothetical protein
MSTCAALWPLHPLTSHNPCTHSTRTTRHIARASPLLAHVVATRGGAPYGPPRPEPPLLNQRGSSHRRPALLSYHPSPARPATRAPNPPSHQTRPARPAAALANATRPPPPPPSATSSPPQPLPALLLTPPLSPLRSRRQQRHLPLHTNHHHATDRVTLTLPHLAVTLDVSWGRRCVTTCRPSTCSHSKSIYETQPSALRLRQ